MPILHVKNLGKADYQPVWQAMKDFTDGRDAHTPDELWLVEHPPVFTQGQAGKAEHLLAPGAIPVVATDRGGQVTYHGPGQLVAYPLLDLRRLKIGVRELVTKIEQSVVALLAEYKIDSAPKADAPGVYVNGDKIASLGLRVRKGCSFHGVAINVDVDLAPFNQINPCGYAGLNMTRLVDLVDTAKQPVVFSDVAERYTRILSNILGLTAQLKE
ncbi:lipoyl(octanoyl) transferase LipB [Saccharophagus degradans]|uniref:Octanoyltransferase n=1 Tax=Saccharophagus degradans TaxID=86304 RepID=A0AAW7XB31_9GAMM|nr:lipoyl(octanoyl) transferase LipB [Saccharophagus degradans]MDO6424415.1 lipoyl(octanoyl) transferase LipB [Saccharophagus degradans]MDO6608378.1 lipoyl(octanoyl) transferase LipB [Saccharophagus degradans]